MKNGKLRAETALSICIMVIIVALMLYTAFGCVQLDPVAIKENGNPECMYNDIVVASCEMQLECNGVGQDGISVLNGNWALCNKDNGVACAVKIAATSTEAK